MSERGFESKEKPPRNLKINSDETADAMRRVEPQGWEAEQKHWSRDGEFTHTLEGALRWLRGEGPNDTGGSTYIIYGFGGWNRWYVGENGHVRFSRRHSNPKAIVQAEAEGFEIS